MGALQMWQAVSEAQGRGRGDTELTIVFTDLSDFSDWALEAGDEQALELLRDVGQAIEPPVDEEGGRVVKRLGDGMMAVFHDPKAALAAVQAGRENMSGIECDGYEPKLRAGLHIGKPRKIGGDYLGVDVNIAARLAENAGAERDPGLRARAGEARHRRAGREEEAAVQGEGRAEGPDRARPCAELRQPAARPARSRSRRSTPARPGRACTRASRAGRAIAAVARHHRPRRRVPAPLGLRVVHLAAGRSRTSAAGRGRGCPAPARSRRTGSRC